MPLQSHCLLEITGRFAVRACAGDEGRAVAASDEVIEVAEHPAPGRGNEGGGEERIFEPLEQVLGPGLQSRGEQLVFKPAGDGITLIEDLFAPEFFVGLLLPEVAQVFAVAQVGELRAVGAFAR